MPSPFPGMDPCFESPVVWPDFHSRFINAWCEAIADRLGDDYVAAIDERVYLIEVDPETRKLIYPDIAVSAEPSGTTKRQRTGDATALLETITIPLEVIEGPRETFIEILHRPDNTLVTVLELLSPANKNEPGRSDYLAKRQAVLRQSVNLVELDLLAGGRRLPFAKPRPRAGYYYFVSAAPDRPNCRVLRWNPPDRLPVVTVPLLPGDGEITVDLSAVFAVAFDRGRSTKRLAYQLPCPAPLDESGLQWAARTAGTNR